MSKKAKTKEKMFEKGMQFENLSVAKQTSEKERKKLIFKLICAAIALIGTISFLACIMGAEGTAAEDVLGVIWIIGMIAMLVCTNISFIKYLGKSIKIAWFLIPVFPIDLLCCIFGAAIFLVLSLYAPIIPCLMTIYQSYVTKKEADEYISACQNYGSTSDTYNE